MYSKPSTRRIKRRPKPLNLVPILDAVFILIFYLLMSAQFFKTYQIGSDYPLASNKPAPPQKKESLNLKINIKKDLIEVFTGMDENLERSFPIEGISSLMMFNKFLVDKKRQYPDEKVAIVTPESKAKYKTIIKVMDYIKSDFTAEEELPLFSDLIIGNIDINK